jgi:hypothetical protein
VGKNGHDKTFLPTRIPKKKQITIFLDIMACNLVYQISNNILEEPEDRNNSFLQTTATYLPNYMISQPEAAIDIFTALGTLNLIWATL